MRAFVEALKKDITQGQVYAVEYARISEVRTEPTTITRRINTLKAVEEFFKSKRVRVAEWLEEIKGHKKLAEAFLQRVLGRAVTVKEVKAEELPEDILARTILTNEGIVIHVKEHDSLASVSHEVLELVIRGLLRVGDKATQIALAQAKRHLAEIRSKQQRKVIISSDISDDNAIDFLAEMAGISAISTMADIIFYNEKPYLFFQFNHSHI